MTASNDLKALPGCVVLALALVACHSEHPHSPPSIDAARTTRAGRGPSSEATAPDIPSGGTANDAHTRGARLRRAPACSYLSVAEVSDILEGPLGKPEEKESEATSSCGYAPLDMTSYQQAQIDIEWHAAGTSTLEDTMAKTFGGTATGSQVAHRVRLGDSSSYSREGVMRIHAGGALISITLMMRPDSEPKAVALGQLLLQRMGYAGAAAAVEPKGAGAGAAQ